MAKRKKRFFDAYRPTRLSRTVRNAASGTTAALLVVGAIGVLGTYLIRSSSAANNTVAVEAESGTPSNSASVTIHQDPNASGGQAVRFNTSSPNPTPNPNPTPSVPVGSKEVFRGDFDPGNFSQWGTCQWKGRNSGCSGYNGQDYMAKLVNDGPGHETAVRFEVRSGDEPDFGGERAEVRASGGAGVVSGDERWYEMQVKFPSDFSNPKPWFIIMQWHAGSGSPPLALEVTSGGQLAFTNNRTGAKTELGPIKKGQWMSLVLHAKFSSGSGMAEAWIDGVKASKVHNQPNMASSSNYLKLGIYRGSQSATHVVFHDGLRITAP